jgi:hypothetical protein
MLNSPSRTAFQENIMLIGVTLRLVLGVEDALGLVIDSIGTRATLPQKFDRHNNQLLPGFAGSWTCTVL